MLIPYIPSVVVIIGQMIELESIWECRKLTIPMVCRLDTDCNPYLSEVGVPINDDSRARTYLFLKSILFTIRTSRYLGVLVLVSKDRMVYCSNKKCVLSQK